MYYEIYQAVKTQLQTPAQSVTGEDREGIALPNEWYNMQYEGTMIHEHGFFTEFPELSNFQAVSKEMRRAPVKIRLHIYSKALQTQDGIPDEAVKLHEVYAEKAKALLDGFVPESACARLTFTGWQHWHRHKGWMVTFVEFEAKRTL